MMFLGRITPSSLPSTALRAGDYEIIKFLAAAEYICQNVFEDQRLTMSHPARHR
jgi:hypothetical protein